MAWVRITAIAALLLAPATASVAQVPPPPPPSDQGSVAEKLVHAFATKDVAAYSALLSDNVSVFEDGQTVAQGKAEWLKAFGPKLTASGVTFKLSPGYASSGRLLFIEYFNTLASWGRTPPPDCCWGYDAVAYDVADGKITAIRRLHGGAARLDGDGKSSAN